MNPKEYLGVYRFWDAVNLYVVDYSHGVDGYYFKVYSEVATAKPFWATQEKVLGMISSKDWIRLYNYEPIKPITYIPNLDFLK
jgi:hypothetical protein